ncbi:MAG: TetR/AcrR family transcriptional regulator [Calditrichaeota bacterium]|nr:TetR/AcrR family transcriptional regulator [Calditrichota bacterium]
MTSSQKTKTKIVKCARENFANRGFHGTSMSSIAVNAGVNKAAVYYHFSSKENLYRLVFQSSLKRIVKSVYNDLIHSRLKVHEQGTDEILDRVWVANPQIMKLFIYELSSGADELRHILNTDSKQKQETLLKLVKIFTMLDESDDITKPLGDEKILIRRATQIVAYSMSHKLVDTVISTIFEKQKIDK